MLLTYTAKTMASPESKGDAYPSQQSLHGATNLPLNTTPGGCNNDIDVNAIRASNNPSLIGRLLGGSGWPLLSASSPSYQMVMSRQTAQQHLLSLGSTSFNPLVSSLSCIGVGDNLAASTSTQVPKKEPASAAQVSEEAETSSSSRKDEKDVSCRIVPCRARGMDPSHNSKVRSVFTYSFCLSLLCTLQYPMFDSL